MYFSRAYSSVKEGLKLKLIVCTFTMELSNLEQLGVSENVLVILLAGLKCIGSIEIINAHVVTGKQ